MATLADDTARLIDELAARAVEEHGIRLLLRDRALERARALESDGGAGGPLWGMPFAVKDMMDLAGYPAMCQSQVDTGRRLASDSWVVTRLEAAGAICIGKTALGEFSLGPDDARPGESRIVNPRDPNWTLGSTSTGSAAAVAGGYLPFAIGTDTGGSIRNPSMAARLAGLKPTTGSLPLAGVFPLAPSMDTVGPMARAASDLSMVWDALGMSIPETPPSGWRPIRVGVVRHFLDDCDEPSGEVSAVLGSVEDALNAVGHELSDVRLPELQAFVAAGWDMLLFEAARTHDIWLGADPGQYHPETRALLEQGQRISETRYREVQALRLDYMRRVDAALGQVDLLLTPTAGYPICAVDDRDGLARLDRTGMRIPFSLTGHPVAALPGPLSSTGYPTGLQLVGRRGEDRELLTRSVHVEEALADLIGPIVPSGAIPPARRGVGRRPSASD